MSVYEEEIVALEARLTGVWLNTVNEDMETRWHNLATGVLAMADPVSYIPDAKKRAEYKITEAETMAAKAMKETYVTLAEGMYIVTNHKGEQEVKVRLLAGEEEEEDDEEEAEDVAPAPPQAPAPVVPQAPTKSALRPATRKAAAVRRPNVDFLLK